MSKLNMDRLAMSNLHYRLYPFDHFLRSQQELGTKSIELYACPPHFIIDWDEMKDCSDIKAGLSEAGLEVVALNPEMGSYPFRLLGGDRELSFRSLEYLKNVISSASDLGAEIVPIACSGALRGCDKGAELGLLMDRIYGLGKYASEFGVRLALETVPGDVLMSDIEAMKKVISGVDLDNVGVCLDVCAVRCAGEKLEQWFQTFGEKVLYVHFTDGRPDGRLVFGQGLHPLDDYIDTIEGAGYKGYYGLNIFNRGMWFDDRYLSEEKGWTGQEFNEENYLFAPEAADKKNLEALMPYML